MEVIRNNAQSVQGAAATSRPASVRPAIVAGAGIKMNDERILRLRVRENAAGLTELDLSRQTLQDLPSEVFNFTRLEVLTLSNNSLERIGPRVGQLRRLKQLQSSHNRLTAVPDTLANCSHLQEVDLSSNRLSDLPASFTQMKGLKSLRLSHNKFEDVPACIGGMDSLRRLDLSHNFLSNLPFACRGLKSLKSLNLNQNRFVSLPPLVSHLRSLECLAMRGNRLFDLPDEFHQLRSLKELNLAGNRFEILPEVLLSLKGLQIFHLGSNRVKHVPYKMSRLPKLLTFHLQNNRLVAFAVDCATLRYLNLANNQLRALSVERQINLRHLNAANNSLEALPLGLCQAVHLEKLLLQRNRLRMLPADVGLLKQLRTLDVSHNQLDSVPHAVNELVHLEYLNIDHNPIRHRPTVLRGTDPLDTVRTSQSVRSCRPPPTHEDGDVEGEVEKLNNRRQTILATKILPLQPSNGNIFMYSPPDEEKEQDSEPIRVDYKLLGLCNQVESLLTKSWMDGTDDRSILSDLIPPVKATSYRKGHCVQTQPDMFIVGPAGGLFSSSADPNVKLYFPVNCVPDRLEIAMQMETIDADAVEDLKSRSEMIENIVSMGHIVHLTVLRPTNITFMTQITVTVPAPPCHREDIRAGKLHLLTYKPDGSCLPCTSGYTMSSGYITMQAWNFAGKGAVVTRAKCRYKACKAVENLLKFIYLS